MLNIQILLAYYNRPKMVRYALESVRRQSYQNWKLAFIDDGSPNSVSHAEVGHALQGHTDKWEYIFADNYQTKLLRGESIVGDTLNKVLLNTTCEIAIVLCDDDALVEGYLEHLNKWFTENPTAVSCYSHVYLFNPLVGPPWGQRNLDAMYNAHTDPIRCSCTVDSSQVAWRTSVNRDLGVLFPSPYTQSLDAVFYQQLNDKTGLTPFSGCVGQYKGIHDRQLSYHLANPFKEPIDVLE